jgi:hypothetical protein
MVARIVIAFAAVAYVGLPRAGVLVSSAFDAGDEGWSSFSFAGVSEPDFANASGGASAVSFTSAAGNPAGSIERTDPDGGWQYFVAPAAFLGDRSAALGGTLTFQQQRRDSLLLPPTAPSALAAISDGATTLVYANSASAPALGAWRDYSVSLAPNAAGWFVGSASGPAATGAQFAGVLANLSGLWLAGEWFAGAISTNEPETIALDNVVLAVADPPPPPPLQVPSPGTLALTLPLLAFWCRRVRR